jgi:hypothetical protein
MALTPLEVQVVDASGTPVNNAVIEVRHELTGVTASPTGYNRDGSDMGDPVTTDSQGGAVVWLPNGIYEWRATGPVTTNWRAFRAYSGFGSESAAIASSPNASMDDPMPPFDVNGTSVSLDTITVPSFGVDDTIGGIEISVDMVFNHMWDLELWAVNDTNAIPLWASAGYRSGATSADDYAFDGEFAVSTVEGADTQYRDGGPTQMVDGTTYRTSGSASGPASGDWHIQWMENGEPAFTGRAGTLRSWSIRFVPI